MHGAHLRICISLGALREDPSKISASRAAMNFKRLMAVRRSEHLISSRCQEHRQDQTGHQEDLHFQSQRQKSLPANRWVVDGRD